MTGEELERLLLQKEGESLKDNAMQGRSPVGGKRVIGKAVAKGGMLLKGRNPQNVRLTLHYLSCYYLGWTGRVERVCRRSNDKKTISGRACPAHPTRTARQ